MGINSEKGAHVRTEKENVDYKSSKCISHANGNKLERFWNFENLFV